MFHTLLTMPKKVRDFVVGYKINKKYVYVNVVVQIVH